MLLSPSLPLSKWFSESTSPSDQHRLCSYFVCFLFAHKILDFFSTSFSKTIGASQKGHTSLPHSVGWDRDSLLFPGSLLACYFRCWTLLHSTSMIPSDLDFCTHKRQGTLNEYQVVWSCSFDVKFCSFLYVITVPLWTPHTTLFITVLRYSYHPIWKLSGNGLSFFYFQTYCKYLVWPDLSRIALPELQK